MPPPPGNLIIVCIFSSLYIFYITDYIKLKCKIQVLNFMVELFSKGDIYEKIFSFTDDNFNRIGYAGICK